jgi:hypothetical protein
MHSMEYALQLLQSLWFNKNTPIYTTFIYIPICILVYKYTNGSRVHINIKKFFGFFLFFGETFVQTRSAYE